MIREEDVRQRLASYLSDQMPLDEFEDWLVQESWDMHKDSSPDAIDLVASIELLLAEYSSRHRTETDLRQEFSDLLSDVVASFKIVIDANIVVRRQSPDHSVRSAATAPSDLLPVVAQG